MSEEFLSAVSISIRLFFEDLKILLDNIDIISIFLNKPVSVFTNWWKK